MPIEAVDGARISEEILVVFGRWGWILVSGKRNGHFAAEQRFGCLTPCK